MICVSVQEKSLQGCLRILRQSPMAELRADLCKLTVAELEEAVASHPNLLVTCRIANSSVEYAREQLVTAIRKGAKYVDVEIEAPVDFLEYIKVYAQVNGTKLIVSYHNFEGTPSYRELVQIADVCRRKGADIVKIVTTANTITDAVTTLSLYKLDWWAAEVRTNNYSEKKDVQLLAFSMGETGKFTRYLSLKLGAPYTYCAFGEYDGEGDNHGNGLQPINGGATAPGQYTMAQMEKLLERGEVELDYRLKERSTSIPCSKSVAQRAILAAAFAKGESFLSNFEPCNDIEGAVRVVEQLGCKVEYLEGERLYIKSGGIEAISSHLAGCDGDITISTGESGLLTRLLIPLAAAMSGDGKVVEITGHGSILGRNLAGAADAVVAAGANCETTDGGYLPFKVGGGIKKSEIEIDGSGSSQIVSGFLMTMPLLKQNSILRVKNPASVPYIELTLDLLGKFGIVVNTVVKSRKMLIYEIEGGQEYRCGEYYMEPDWSSAAFFAVAYAISSMKEALMGNSGTGYTLKRMALKTRQADEAVLQVLNSAGVTIEKSEAGDGLYDITFIAGKDLLPFEFDATDAPDLFPILALFALFCNGRSSIRGVNRLLQKESNRAESIFTELSSLGGDISISDDVMYIEGAGCSSEGAFAESLTGGNLHSHNDHRIAMTIIVASLFIKQKMTLDEVRCIDKSFPSFLSRFESTVLSKSE